MQGMQLWDLDCFIKDNALEHNILELFMAFFLCISAVRSYAHLLGIDRELTVTAPLLQETLQ
jgi:hypothetical protein